MSTRLSIMTYNVWNVWRIGRLAYNRDDMIADVVFEHTPDILCLQEFDGPFRHEEKDLVGMLSPLYLEAAPEVVAPDDNWNPIFYKPLCFELIACGHHVYTHGTEYTYRLISRSHFRTLTWAVLQNRASGERITVLNTHYDTDTANHQTESDELCDLAEQLKKEYGGQILVTGDYNCRMAGIAVQNMLSRGFTDTNDLAAEKCTVSACHPYPTLNEETKLFDTYDDNFYDHSYAAAIDHVMLLGQAEVESYRAIINEKTLLTSDHSPMLVKMTLIP